MNMLLVSGPDEEVMRLKGQVRGENNTIDCNNIIPMPEALSNNPSPIRNEKLKQEHIEKYGAPDWHEWAILNWGTKWGCYDCTDWMDNRVDFQSAWGPPDKAIRVLATQFPKLTIELIFYEPGMVFAGIVRWENGEVVEDESKEDVEYVSFIAENYFNVEAYEEEEDDVDEMIEQAEKNKT